LEKKKGGREIKSLHLPQEKEKKTTGKGECDVQGGMTG